MYRSGEGPFRFDLCYISGVRPSACVVPRHDSLLSTASYSHNFADGSRYWTVLYRMYLEFAKSFLNACLVLSVPVPPVPVPVSVPDSSADIVIRSFFRNRR